MAEAYEWRNPVFNHAGTIDCEINHAVYGWIPFTASPNDVLEEGQLTHADIIASGAPITVYTPPTAEEARKSMTPLSQRQMRLGLLAKGITKEDIQSAIVAIVPVDEERRADVEFTYADYFLRTNPSVIQVLKLLNMTDAQIDTFWGQALLI